VNATDSKKKFRVEVSGVRLAGNAMLWQSTAKDLDAANHVGQSPQVEVKETAIGEVPSTLSVPPISVNIYRLPA
jgi:alpha-L-arabinofuranosidase